MGKVKIAGCREKGKTKQNKPWYEVNLEDGRAPTGFENLTEFIGQEIELDVFKNDKGYWAYKPPKKGGAAPKTDKQIALECASRMESNPDEVIKAATKYLEWLTKE